MLVQKHQVECVLADVALGAAALFGFSFPRACSVSSLRTFLLLLSALPTTSDMLPSNFTGPTSAAWLKSHSICQWSASMPAVEGIKCLLLTYMSRFAPLEARIDAKLRVFGWIAL